MDRSYKALQLMRQSRQENATRRNGYRLRRENKALAEGMATLSRRFDALADSVRLGNLASQSSIVPSAPKAFDELRPPKQTKGKQSENYVYFLLAPEVGAVKIGKTRNLLQRLQALQTGCPVRLSLLGWVPGYSVEEKVLHRYFDNLWLLGEWFSHSDPLIRYIEIQGRLNQYVNPKDFFGRCQDRRGGVPSLQPKVVKHLELVDQWINQCIPSIEGVKPARLLLGGVDG